MRVLLIEDDESLGSGLVTTLKRAGYTVDWLRSGNGVAAALGHDEIDGVILDLGLPGIDGIEVLQEIRALGNPLPVMIITARDAIPDRIQGLDAGADDYLVKPFDVGEFKARLRALLRRRPSAPDAVASLGDLSIDMDRLEASWKGEPLELSRREITLLNELVINQGRILSREVLLRRIYGWDGDVTPNALEVHVHHLRRKLPENLIRTVRGVGYIAEEPT